MPLPLELSVILTTYHRPAHLQRSLHSLALQRGVSGKIEIIVADDGSEDQSESIVREFAHTAPFPVKWITHPHEGFRVSLCRNDGVRASSAPYLLFTDSDCLFPEDHLANHLRARRPGIIRAGDCYRLDQAATDRVDADAITNGEYRQWVPRDERRRIFQKRIKDQYYRLIRHSTKPKLTGYNIGVSREDLETVNGFDENFVGWGCEDDDLAYRLRMSGKRVASVLNYTHGYHMWHPTEPSRPAKWTDGPNVVRLEHLDRPLKCKIGLVNLASRTSNLSAVEAVTTHRSAIRRSRHAA